MACRFLASGPRESSLWARFLASGAARRQPPAPTRSQSTLHCHDKSRPPVAAKWAPGDTAWVEFRHGTYKCELVSLRYGYWTVKWANGDTEPQKVDEKKLLREAPQKLPRSGGLLRVPQARADADRTPPSSCCATTSAVSTWTCIFAAP